MPIGLGALAGAGGAVTPGRGMSRRYGVRSPKPQFGTRPSANSAMMQATMRPPAPAAGVGAGSGSAFGVNKGGSPAMQRPMPPMGGGIGPSQLPVFGGGGGMKPPMQRPMPPVDQPIPRFDDAGNMPIQPTRPMPMPELPRQVQLPPNATPDMQEKLDVFNRGEMERTNPNQGMAQNQMWNPNPQPVENWQEQVRQQEESLKQKMAASPKGNQFMGGRPGNVSMPANDRFGGMFGPKGPSQPIPEEWQRTTMGPESLRPQPQMPIGPREMPQPLTQVAPEQQGNPFAALGGGGAMQNAFMKPGRRY